MAVFNYNKRLVANAKALRTNMTKEEKHLWYDFLKKLPVTVNRQKIVGDYILDFFIASKKIAIELDGSQHGMAEHKESDQRRDQELRMLGITVLRYTNQDIHLRFHSVCRDILKHMDVEERELK